MFDVDVEIAQRVCPGMLDIFVSKTVSVGRLEYPQCLSVIRFSGEGTLDLPNSQVCHFLPYAYHCELRISMSFMLFPLFEAGAHFFEDLGGVDGGQGALLAGGVGDGLDGIGVGEGAVALIHVP